MRSVAGNGGAAVAAAMRSRIQYFSNGLEMKRYSVPILPQYTRRITAMIWRSGIRSPPLSPPVQNSRSRSQIVRPCVSSSSSGWFSIRRVRRGSMSASRCPRTR